MLKSSIQKLMTKQDLTPVEIEKTLDEMIETQNEVQIAAFLSLLRSKGETVDEVTCLVDAMRSKMLKVSHAQPVLDIVGTGGDGYNTVNISTGSALLAASCGVKVAKHGNRAVSSLAGSADVLFALGMNIELSPEQVTSCIDQFNFGFCYAPNFHLALGKLKQVRRQLGVATTFNLLGPLLNPAQAEYMMIGVSDPRYLDLVAQVLIRLDVKHGLVFHCQGLDEVCCVGIIDAIEVKSGAKKQMSLDPDDYGFKRSAINDLQGGTAQENAKLIRQALSGVNNPLAETLIFNAGIANYIYGLAETIETGIAIAKATQQSGAVSQLISRLVEHTNSFLTSEEEANA